MPSLIPTAYAATIDPASIGLPDIGTFGDLVSNIWELFLYGAGILLFFYFLLGGFKYLTAGGDDKAVQTAKKMLTNAITGILIIFATYWIVLIIQEVIGISILS